MGDLCSSPATWQLPISKNSLLSAKIGNKSICQTFGYKYTQIDHKTHL
jgi:hypothetical protein